MSIENVSTDALIREMETLAVGIVDPIYQLSLTEFIRRFKIAKAAIEQIVDPKPLTLEELRQMNGEPVWIDDWWEDSHGWELSMDASDYFDGERRTEKEYGSIWVAYRYKPKEE